MENVDGDALAELDQAEKNVLRAHVVVVETVRLFAGKGEDLLGARGEIVHVDSLNQADQRCNLRMAGSGTPLSLSRRRSARKASRSSAPSFFWEAC